MELSPFQGETRGGPFFPFGPLLSYLALWGRAETKGKESEGGWGAKNAFFWVIPFFENVENSGDLEVGGEESQVADTNPNNILVSICL